MARRKASTATRPPDSFMKAYEAEGRQIIEGAIAHEQESAEGFKVGDRVYVNQSPQSPWVILKIDGAIAHLKRLSSGFENTWLISELCPWEFKYYPEQWVKVKHETYPVVIEDVDHFKTEPDDGVRYYKVLAAPWLGTDEERRIAQSAIEYEVLKPAWLDLDDGDMVIAELEAGSYMPGIIADAYSHADTVEAKVLWDSGITSKIQMQELLPFASDWRVGDRVTEDINSENAYKEGWASDRNRTHGTIIRFVKNSGKFYPQIRNADGALQTVNPECLKHYKGDEPLPEPESPEPPMTAEQVVAEMDRALQGGAEPTEGLKVGDRLKSYWVIIFQLRTHPYRLPEFAKVRVVRETPHTIRVTDSDRQWNQPKHKAWCLPTQSSWEEFQDIYAAYQGALDDLAAKLRGMDRYDRLLKKNPKGANPLTPTAIEIHDPDYHHAWSTEEWRSPQAFRYELERHTPVMLRTLKNGKPWGMQAQALYFACPDDETWECVEVLAVRAKACADALTVYLNLIGTYAQVLKEGEDWTEEPSNLATPTHLILGTRFQRGDRVQITADDDLKNYSAIVERSFEADGHLWAAVYCSELPSERLEYPSKLLSFVAGAAPSSLAELERLMEPGEQVAAEPASTHELAKSDPLTTLATNIKAAYNDCEQALTVARSAESSALEHAKRCGELLTQAKAANGHGGWEAWRMEHTGIPSSTASLYQRIAERWDEIQELGLTSLKAIDKYFREAKKLKANPQPSADLPAQPASDDRQIIPATKVAAIAQSGWIQTKDGKNLNPLHYRVEGAEDIKAETLIDEDEGEFTELLELDDELIAANLVIGDARATIEALLEQICFLPEDEGAIPCDPPNPYKGWQIATDSPNEGMIAICLYAPWGAWWALPTEEFFEYGDHDRAIEWAQGVVDRLEVAAERAEKPEPKAKKVKVGAGHLRAIAKEQSASAFKLLNGMKGNMSEDVDLLGVADALEEAIMQVLEEWILGEEG